MDKVIYKRICLEDFKSRIPGLVPFINKSNDGYESNWGKIPYDLRLGSFGETYFVNLRNYLLDSHYDLYNFNKETEQWEFNELVFEERNSENDKKRYEKLRLRYKDMMQWYYWIIDLYKKSPIYEWSTNNGVIEENPQGKWVLMDNFNMFDSEMRKNVKLVFAFNKEEYVYKDEVYISEWDNITNPKPYYMIVSREEKEFFDNHDGLELFTLADRLTGKIPVPNTITGKNVPRFVYISELQDLYDSLYLMMNSEDCCIREKYEDLGGSKFFWFVDENLKRVDDFFENEIIHDHMPYCDIPIALTQDIEDLGLAFSGEQEWIEGNKYDMGDIVSYNGLTYMSTIDSNYGVYDEKYDEVYFDKLNNNGEIVLSNWEEYVEDSGEQTIIEGESTSQLNTFRTKRGCYTDNGYELEGILPYNYDEIDFSSDETAQLVVDEYGYVTLDLPFIYKKVLNISKDDKGQKYGDVLYDIIDKEDDKTLTFRYVIGLKLRDDETYVIPDEKDIENFYGIYYQETYLYSTQETREIVDGKPVKIRYKAINYDLNVENGSTKVILSKIKYRSNDVWNADFAITAPIYRKDYLIGMSEQPMTDVNIVIDRGLSHAFEKHLMLTETNTFNDLKNYKNNYFNLQ